MITVLKCNTTIINHGYNLTVFECRENQQKLIFIVISTEPILRCYTNRPKPNDTLQSLATRQLISAR